MLSWQYHLKKNFTVVLSRNRTLFYSTPESGARKKIRHQIVWKTRQKTTPVFWRRFLQRVSLALEMLATHCDTRCLNAWLLNVHHSVRLSTWPLQISFRHSTKWCQRRWVNTLSNCFEWPSLVRQFALLRSAAFLAQTFYKVVWRRSWGVVRYIIIFTGLFCF